MKRCRPPHWILAACVAASFATCLGTGQAKAQGWGLFDFFGGQRPVQVPQRDRILRPRHRLAPRPAPLESAEPVRRAAQRKPGDPEAAHGVVVLGDNFAQPLANGLDEAFDDRSDVAILHKARDSTGLARESIFDWPKSIRDFLDAKLAGAAKMDAAVMMIGLNDTHSLVEGGKSYAPDSPDWTAIYTRRVIAIMDAFKAKKIPLIWVGIPIVEEDNVADRMAALNEIFRDAAAKTGTDFVDTWAAFSDDDGDYTATGPDVDGQIVRLRSAGGMRFTRAGARKLAHFVEVDIRRILDRGQDFSEPPAIAALPGAGTAKDGPLPKPPGKEALVPGAPSSPAVPAKPPEKPEAGPVMILSAVPAASDGHLAQPGATRSLLRADPLLDAALVKGEAQLPHPGRADDASWPPK